MIRQAPYPGGAARAVLFNGAASPHRRRAGGGGVTGAVPHGAADAKTGAQGQRARVVGTHRWILLATS
jgi:hypothetical protein